ncbi:hypothetical protein Pfo_001856, partial [Paulownia fortunei]
FIILSLSLSHTYTHIPCVHRYIHTTLYVDRIRNYQFLFPKILIFAFQNCSIPFSLFPFPFFISELLQFQFFPQSGNKLILFVFSGQHC